jgi:AhpD family alkylhydroperoxidase
MQQRLAMEKVNPQGYTAMLGLEKYLATTSLDKKLKELIKLRASEINGCEYCVAFHTKDALKIGESQERINALNSWRESSLFTSEERAVLALTEAITLIAEKHVPDEIYNEVRNLFDEKQTADIIMAIITINGWNRIAISTNKIA